MWRICRASAHNAFARRKLLHGAEPAEPDRSAADCRPLEDAMRRLLPFLIVFLAARAPAQELPTRWDELAASDWQKALELSKRTAVLPIGVLEKHGPHAPIGSDLIHAREWAARVAKAEYAVVFPDYFYGQIYEARHQPGTFALPSQLILGFALLDVRGDRAKRVQKDPH